MHACCPIYHRSKALNHQSFEHEQKVLVLEICPLVMIASLLAYFLAAVNAQRKPAGEARHQGKLLGHLSNNVLARIRI
jgi:hypothetical protein